MKTVFYIVTDEAHQPVPDSQTDNAHEARMHALRLCESAGGTWYVMKLVGMAAPPARDAEWLAISA